MTLDEAKALAEQIIEALSTRFLLNQKNFLLKVVDENGFRTLE